LAGVGPSLGPGSMQAEREVGHEFLIFGEDHRLVGADDDDQIVPDGQVVLVKAEGLAEEAFDAVAARGGADAAADDDGEARMGQGVRESVDDQRSAGVADAGVEDGGDLVARAEAVGLGEGVGFVRHT